MNEMLVDRFRPESYSEIQGNNKSLKQIKKWAKNWEVGDNPLLLHGPPGTGKTTTAMVTADTYDWNLVEINASSKRRKDDIKEIAEIVDTRVNGSHQLILLDEVDSYNSTTSLKPITNLLKNPPNPIILTANDIYSVPHSIKNHCSEFKFKLGKRSRKAKIRKIAEELELDIPATDIQLLASRQDLRSAINDLQLYMGDGDMEVGKDARTTDGASDFDAVDHILLGNSGILSDTSHDTFIYWLIENFRADQSALGTDERDLQGIEVTMMYNALAEGDMHLRTATRFYGETMIERSGELRLTEPFMPNRISKSYPSYFRWSKPNPDSDKLQAKLFRRLKGGDDAYTFSGNYTYFREVQLPILRKEDESDLFQMCVEYNVQDPEVVAVLGLDPSRYESYRGTNEEEYEENKDRVKGVLDF